MTAKILMVVTSHSELGNTGGKTGVWLEELAAPYNAFVDAGLAVEIASPLAGVAPLDPASLEAPWLAAAGQRFLADAAAMDKLSHSLGLDAIDPTAFKALFLVGGAGAAWDFTTSARLAEIVEALDRRDAILAGVCHGVLGLTAAKSRSGQSLVSGRRVTAVSNAEEVLTTLDTVVPVMPEQRLIELGASYSCAGEAFGEHVVIDANLMTGQNPASAALLAQGMIKALQDVDVIA